MINKKNSAEVLEVDDPGGGAFVLFLRPHPGAFRQLLCPHPGEFAHFFKKMLMPGLARGGWAPLELTDALLGSLRNHDDDAEDNAD